MEKKKWGRILIKRIAPFLFSFAIAVPATFPAYAADITPRQYMLALALRACGLSLTTQIGQWEAAYIGYLESTKNTAMLNRFNSYSNLSWGGTVSGMDEWYQGVKSWINSGNYHFNKGGVFSLSSSSAPVPDSGFDVTGIRPTAFSDVCTTPDIAGYTYIFSDTYSFKSSSGRTMYIRRNIFAPPGEETFIITTSFSRYTEKVTAYFFQKDSFSSTGYKEVFPKSMAASYWVDDGSLNGKDTKFNNTFSSGYQTSIRNLMNISGIKVFCGALDAEEYCKTGTVKGTFSKDKCALWSNWGSKEEELLLSASVSSIGSTLSFPANASLAVSNIYSLNANLDKNALSSALLKAGFSIGYELPYTVEYYQDGKKIRTKTGGVSSLSPQVDSVPSYLPGGYRIDKTQTTPLPYPVSELNHVIRVYYIPDPDSPITATKNGMKSIMETVLDFIFSITPFVCMVMAFFILIRVAYRFYKRNVEDLNKGNWFRKKK